jgi:hypothetical protein
METGELGDNLRNNSKREHASTESEGVRSPRSDKVGRG